MTASQEWHYSKNGQALGPVSSAQLKELASTGQLLPSDLIWKEGLAEWKVAGSVKGLFAEPPATVPPPLPQNLANENVPEIPSAASNVTNTVKSDLNDIVSTAKHAKDLAVAHTRRTQITQMTLPKAFLALGKDVFVSERFREEFSDLFERITATNDEIAKIKASSKERPQATDLKGKLQSGAAQLMAQGQTIKLGFQRDSLVRELGKKAFESHRESAGSPELVSPITSAIEEIEKLDAQTKPSSSAERIPFWQRVPLAMVLTIGCFPVGLYLVWYNPRITRRSKVIWIGGFAALFIGMMIFAQIRIRQAREDLVAANQLWGSGDKQAAVSKYRTLVKDHLHAIPENERSLIYGRVIDFDAESGNVASAEKLLQEAEDDHVVPSVSSEKARPLIANRNAEKKASEAAVNVPPQHVPPVQEVPVKQVVEKRVEVSDDFIKSQAEYLCKMCDLKSSDHTRMAVILKKWQQDFNLTKNDIYALSRTIVYESKYSIVNKPRIVDVLEHVRHVLSNGVYSDGNAEALIKAYWKNAE